MQPNWEVTPEEKPIIDAIVERAAEMLPEWDKTDIAMDVVATHNHVCRLRLADLLAADNFNFVHDIVGIAECLDRENLQFLRAFWPRFAAPVLPIVNSAILYALDKNCIVVFSAGNSNSPLVNYPKAVDPRQLIVGAISYNGARKSPSTPDGESWGSNYGDALDVMAPGVKIPTTDILGSNGYTSGDYIEWTSMAPRPPRPTLPG